MLHLTITHRPSTSSEACALCGKSGRPGDGPHLFLADSLEPVCHECGKAHAPSLAALLDLARVARRVGRIGRHTLVPPMGALLDLARAAEHYTESSCERCRQAA
jgi:hypothetical protein